MMFKKTYNHVLKKNLGPLGNFIADSGGQHNQERRQSDGRPTQMEINRRASQSPHGQSEPIQ